MPKQEITTAEKTNVRWEIPDDCIEIIVAHQKVLALKWDREFVTREEAAIDLIRSRPLPKITIEYLQ